MGLWESLLADPQPGPSVYTDLLSFAFRGPVHYDQQRPIFIDAEDPSRSLNAAQFRVLVRTLIAGLKAHHVQRGDCVLVHLGNNVSHLLNSTPYMQPQFFLRGLYFLVFFFLFPIFLFRFFPSICPSFPRRRVFLALTRSISFSVQIIYPALFFSIIGAGGVFMGSNARSQPNELEHILELADPKLIITSREALPTVLDVSASRGMLPSQVCLLDETAPDHITQLLLAGPLAYAAAGVAYLPGGGDGCCLNFAHLLGYGENDWISFDNEAIAKSTPAAMFSTSGTGGLPKAALLSHHAIVSHHLSINYDVPYEVTRLMSLPMFHLFGALWTHIFPIRCGQPLFVLSRFDLTQFVVAVYQYQITETYMVPAMIHTFNRTPLPVADYLASLRYVGVAGAPIDGGSMQHFQDMLHVEAQASQLWGMTEVGVVFQNRYGEPGSAAGIGRLVPGYEVALMGRDGHPVWDENTPGELYVRGAGVLIGYKGRNDATDAQGWFRTGDVAYVNNGNYFIVGRTKELIKVRGYVLLLGFLICLPSPGPFTPPFALPPQKRRNKQNDGK